MTEHEASRTLVKSPPELWAECSEAANLARHLGQFGEITITRLEPEDAVAWEGTLASGTVRLEPSGWGTKVILTAQEIARATAPPEAPETTVGPEASEPGPDNVVPTSDPDVPQPAVPAAAPARAGGLFSRLFGRFRPPARSVPSAADPIAVPEPVLTPEPVVAPERVVAPEPVAVSEPALGAAAAASVDAATAPVRPTDFDAEAILVGALDSLGQAHHRPFSRG